VNEAVAIPTVDALIEREQLPQSYRAIIDAHWRPLTMRIAAWFSEAARPIIVGVNGGQGSGKTTLCLFLEEILLPESGLRAVTVSLDDFYLSAAERQKCADTVHPLFAVRGVPGTHDVSLMIDALNKLINGASAVIPKFDKASDDRAPSSDWTCVGGPVDVILFEGWCVGAAPQTEEALIVPVNALEAEEDPDGVWRRHVNRALAAEYRELFRMIDRLVILRAPNMETILANRREQERKLRDARPDAPNLLSDADVARFVQFYERLTRWMLAELPARADVVFDLADLTRVQTSVGGTSR
jgi:D-glycerate 3-kinase